MKKLLSLSLGCLMLSGLAFGDSLTVKAPVTDHGVAVSPLYAGYKYKTLATTTETLVCSAPCILAGLIMSSGANTAHVYLRDSGTADNGNSTNVIDLTFRTATDCAPVFQPIIPLPLRGTYGWAVDLSSIATGETVTVIYVDLD